MSSTAARGAAIATALVSLAATLFIVGLGSAGAAGLDQGLVVSDDPVDFTPHVLDGQVNGIATVGSWVVIGGNFTQVREAGSATVQTRNNLFAFDRNTGAVSSTFVPTLDGEVRTVAAAEDGTSVFIGGRFANVNGGSNYGLAKLNVATGAKVPGFNATTAGKVRDLQVNNGKVYLGGDIWSVNGVRRNRMAVVDAVTGAVDPTFAVSTTLPRVSVDWVSKLDVKPDGSSMVIIGNFLEVDGLPRAQIAMIDLTGPAAEVADWSTEQFSPTCSGSFWTYMRDVGYAPGGDFFVTVSTGAPFIGTLCDTASRWESDASGSGLLETWADWSGGDTLSAVAVSDVAVYIGGHQRWMNNHLGRDSATPAAVRRDGIAALDPINGVPFAWNPGKDRGVAVFDLHLSDLGLYVGSDTDFTAGELHPKLARFPLTGGTPVPVPTPASLPSGLFSGDGATLTTRSFDGTTLGADAVVAGNVLDYDAVGGAFYQAGNLYYMESGSGDLRSRPFDGETMGGAATEPSWVDWGNATSAAWFDGRLYVTEAGSHQLRYQYFSLESGIVGSQTFTVSGPADGLDWIDTTGAAFADGRLYYATVSGDLYVIEMNGVAPVSGTEMLLSGPAAGDGRNWSGADLFFFGDGAAPTVALTNPIDDATVQGVISVTATASDDNAIESVEFFVGAASLGIDTDGSDGWSAGWDTTSSPDGSATVIATATNDGGQTATDQAMVWVDNLGPTVTITAPLDGATVGGIVAFGADAADAVGVEQVEFFVDAVSIGVDTVGADGWSATWNATAHPDGAAALTATATDAVGRTDSDGISVTVSNLSSGIIVMVVANPASLSSGDTAVRNRLEGLGYAVSVIDDDGVTPSASSGAAFVVVSSTVSGSKVGGTFRNVPEPLWISKPWLLDDMGMTGTVAWTDYGVASTTSYLIDDPGSPLAAGLSGVVGVTTAVNPVSWGSPAEDGDVVASVGGFPVVFAYQPGATLADGGTAAGCRLGVSIYQQAPAYFTTDGWAMFDAAAAYAGAGCGDPGPTVVITAPADGATVSGSVAVTATATAAGTVSQVEFLVGGTSLGIDTDGADGWSLSWDTATGNDGVMSIEAIATDDAGQMASDVIGVTVDNLGLNDTRVVLVSVDGLRPDQVLALGAAEVPNLFRMIEEGSATSNARTVYDMTRTLPNHTSMLTALPVLGVDGHQVTFNEDNGLTVHDAAGRYVPSVFDVAHDRGLSTLLFAGKPKFDFLDRSWDAANGAPDTTGADDGRDKIDHYQTGDGATMTAAYVSLAEATPIDLSVIHYASPDAAGHDFGWASNEYLDAVRDVDSHLGNLLAFIENDPAYVGITTLVLTSDHGGSGTDHADETDPLNYTVPLFAWGSGVAGGGDLYAMNTATRLDPGTGRPDHVATPQPIRNADVANLALGLAGVGPISGSTINAIQDLDLATLPPDAIPTVAITAPANGVVVSGVVAVLADADDDVGVTHVEFFVQGVSIGVDANGGDGWGVSWDTTAGTDGAMTVSAVATDTSDQVASDAINVTVDNGLAPVVVMVVGNPAALGTGDQAVRDQLEALGYTVAIYDDNVVAAGDASGAAFVLVASTVNSGTVGSTFYGAAEPVWMAKPWALDDMGMTGTAGGVDYGSSSTTIITIVAPAHQLAAGLSGDITVVSGTARMSWGVPGAAAAVIATADGLPTTFVYQAGETLADGATAAGCRLTASLFQGAPANFTADGRALFEAAVDYMANGCG